MSKFYITTAIPYVNGRPHVGHALEFVQTDALARFHRLSGKETRLLTGADENALKNVQTAEKEGLPVQEFLDKYSQYFRDFCTLLNVQADIFQRGSDRTLHWPGVQKFWQLCDASGDLYKKTYSGLYCVGCEAYYTPEELNEDGLCPNHLKAPEKVEEENFFFRLSRYQEQLHDLIASDAVAIVPSFRKKEILNFIDQGLNDFSVSRSIERARGIGVPVPGDDNQVMYVWFDALNIYMTGLGFGQEDESLWERLWPADIHVIGKDILRFHAIYWIAMLLSARLPLPKKILTHGFLTSNGQKMSKSLGNVVDPFALVEKYGVDPVRYYLLKEVPTQDDGDYSETRFLEVYNAELANSLGNTASRVAKMAANIGFTQEENLVPPQWLPGVAAALEYELDIRAALSSVMAEVAQLEKQIAVETPWALEPDAAAPLIAEYVAKLREVAWNLRPFLPGVAEVLFAAFSAPSIVPLSPLFPKLKG